MKTFDAASSTTGMTACILNAMGHTLRCGHGITYSTVTEVPEAETISILLMTS